jgi:glutamate dehydrogenase (NAD(P)+)
VTTMQEPMGPAGDELRPLAGAPVVAAPLRSPGPIESPRSRQPYLRMTWTDPVTGATGHLVVHSLVSGMATGGTRMRAGCTMTEVEDLAFGMAAASARPCAPGSTGTG